MIDTATIESLEKIATKLHKAGVFPAEVNSPDKAFAILLAGDELGFAPMAAARSIALVKGKVSLGADAQIGLCKRSPACKYFHLVESTETLATYITHRDGDPEPTTLTYTIAMAQTAGLAGSQTWRSHPKAMLRARCGAALSRAVYPDVCAGLYDPDEAEEIRRNGHPAPPVDAVPSEASGAPAQPAPLDALDAFRAVLAECGDLATIAAAYQGAGLGGTSAKDVGAIVRDRATALGYHLNAADVTALLGGSMPAATVLAYDRLACVDRHADDADGDAVVAEVVRVLRSVGGLDAPTRIKTAAVATCTALDVADAAKRIAAALRPTPPDGGPSGTRTPAAPAPADATAAPLPTGAANDASQASAGPRVGLDADETERRLVTSAPAWVAYLAERVAAQVPVFALCGSYWKRREAFAAEGVAVARYDATLDAVEAREGKGRDAAREALDGYRTRRVMPRGAGEVVQLPRRGDLRATG